MKQWLPAHRSDATGLTWRKLVKEVVHIVKEGAQLNYNILQLTSSLFTRSSIGKFCSSEEDVDRFRNFLWVDPHLPRWSKMWTDLLEIARQSLLSQLPQFTSTQFPTS